MHSYYLFHGCNGVLNQVSFSSVTIKLHREMSPEGCLKLSCHFLINIQVS